MALSPQEFNRVNPKDKKLVFGFIRESQTLLSSSDDNPYFIITDLIIHICLAYYHIKHSWRMTESYTKSIMTKTLTLSNEDRIASVSGTGPKTVFSKRSVNSGINHWRIRINKLQVSVAWSMTIGVCLHRESYIKHKDSGDGYKTLRSNDNTFAYTQTNRYGYCVNIGQLVAYKGGSRTDYGKKCVEGDIVEMILDLDKRELQYIVNDVEYGIAYGSEQIVEGEYYAAANLYNQGDCVEFL